MGFIYSDCKRPRPLPCGGTECPVAMKHALAVLNQAVSLHKKSGEELSYKNAHEFGEMLAKRIYTIKIYNLENRNTAVLSNQDIKKYNLEEYKDNPIIATARGTYFMIPKFETGCRKVNIVNPENSDCLIDVDLNGIERKPNKKEGYNPKRPSVNDRYTFIIDGNNNHIILPGIYQNNSRSKNGR